MITFIYTKAGKEDIMKERGLEAVCYACYMESKRSYADK